MSDIKKLLDLMEKELENNHPNGIDAAMDRALWHLLKAHEDVLPDLDDRFHKNFRQIDVTDNGHVDAAIWVLLTVSGLFWKVYGHVRGCDKESA